MLTKLPAQNKIAAFDIDAQNTLLLSVRTNFRLPKATRSIDD